MTNTEAKRMFENMLAEIEAADSEMFSPHNPMESKNETLLCVCEDNYIRKCYALATFYRRESEHAKIDIKMGGTDIRYDANFNRQDDLSDLLHNMFWVLLREKYSLWDKGGIGIRQEWKVVKLKDDNEYNSEGGKSGPRSGIAVIEGRSLPEAIRKIIEQLGE